MSVSAIIENGKVVETAASANTDSTKKATGNDSLDKDAFLQLLVTQMQYQDPLEPTSNTEYISQLATFSELEAMNNLNNSMSIQRATELVGERVIMKTTSSSTGETYMTQGMVDYVVIEEGKAYLAINESLFSIDDLDTVIDASYWEEYENKDKTETDVTDVTKLLASIIALPDTITLDDEAAVKSARESYNTLSSEYKLKVDDESLIKLIKAEATIAKLKAAESDTDIGDTTDTESDDTEATDTIE